MYNLDTCTVSFLCVFCTYLKLSRLFQDTNRWRDS